MCNKQRQFPKTEKQVVEEHRSVILHKVMALLSGIEQETPLLVDSNNSAHEVNKMKQS